MIAEALVRRRWGGVNVGINAHGALREVRSCK